MSRLRALLLAGLLGGCNQLFGLEPPREVDAADTDDVDGGDMDDDAGDDGDGGRIDALPPGTPGTVWALSIDVVTPAGAMRGYEMHPAFGPKPEDCILLASSAECRTERCMPRTQQLPIPHSGIVTVEGNRLVNATPDNNGLYPTPSGSDGQFFDPGVTTGAYSVGAGVPQFSAVLVAPSIITFTAPPTLPSATSPGVVQRSAGINLTWTPAVAGAIFLILSDASGGRTYCNLSSSAGNANVPANVLTPLNAGAGNFYSYSVATTTTTAGTYTIQYTAAQAARRSDNDWARGTITLQ